MAELVDEAALPTLPVESPEFWADLERFLAPARERHPWLARFSHGFVAGPATVETTSSGAA